MKIAIVCSGAGRIQRGYERFTTELFVALSNSLDVTFFKGGGQKAQREKVLWNVPRDGLLSRLLPIHRLVRRSSYDLECLTFALVLYPHLVRERYHIVHYIDPPLGNFLYHLKRILRGKFQLVYTNGVGMSPLHYMRPDHVHQMAHIHYQTALEFGMPSSHMTLLPPGVDMNRFYIEAEKRELRKKHQISNDDFVVLSISAINRGHKRLDYLIDELARLNGNYFLWLDGYMEDLAVPKLAQEKLGKKFRISCVPSEQVGELFRLADLFVLTSIEEGFGLAVVEAMLNHLPVLTHCAPHFQWLVDNEDCLIDMRASGNLALHVQNFREQPELLERIAKQNYTVMQERFDWKRLAPGYIEMYRRVTTNENLLYSG